MRRVYLDYASTTAIHPEVLKTYTQLLEKYFANSESLYDEGVDVFRSLEKARAGIASLLGVKSDEVLFTSGSSESNSTAIKSVCFAQKEKNHIVTSCIEHSSIMNACKQMEEVFGYKVTYLPVSRQGTVSLEDVKKTVTEDTAIVSIMYVNNETGAVNPVAEIAEYIKKHTHAYFHVDLTQAIGKVALDLSNIDLASISAHKLEGLKGSGILIKKRHVPFVPLINGGEQEFGLRGGTSNAVTDMVFAKTLRLALENGEKYHEHIQNLHDILVEGLTGIDGVEMNTASPCIPSTVNFSYENIPSEIMQNALNARGFLVSSRSTCDSHSHNPSYVLLAMGYSEKRASSCIRVSFSYQTSREDIEQFIFAVKEIIHQYGEL